MGNPQAAGLVPTDDRDKGLPGLTPTAPGGGRFYPKSQLRGRGGCSNVPWYVSQLLLCNKPA